MRHHHGDGKHKTIEPIPFQTSEQVEPDIRLFEKGEEASASHTTDGERAATQGKVEKGKLPPWDFTLDVEAAARGDLVDGILQRRPKRPRQNRMHMEYSDKVAAFADFVGQPQLRRPESARPLELSKEQLRELLGTSDYELELALYDYANAVTESIFGPRVSFRGIVEFSNVCVKDCGYCGIRKHRAGVGRYTMKDCEIVDVALWAFDHGYGSLMLQSGELPTPSRHQWMLRLIREIKARSLARELDKGVPPGLARGMGVAIGLGELPRQYYQELFEAGAHRYLLRIETSNPDLYARLHPPDHSWTQRVRCLQNLKDIGYQLGTGVMIGLPGQTLSDLAGDILFFKQMEADMIGCGPYILQEETPVGQIWKQQHPNLAHDDIAYSAELLELTCRFLALTRITLGDVNISATTALQAINPIGREIALGRGANQLMPILTTTTYRQNYQLYAGKPCIDEGHEDCRSCLTKRVEFAGKQLHLNDWADPPSYLRRQYPPLPDEVLLTTRLQQNQQFQIS